MSLNALFPDCIIHDMPQRSDEWHAIRSGKLTASQAGEWLAERPACRMEIKDITAKLDDLRLPYTKKAKRDELLAMLPDEHRTLSITETTRKAKAKAIAKIIGAMAKVNCPDPLEVDPEGPPPRNPSLWAIWNGIREEPSARLDFERWSGNQVVEVGFCLHKSGVAGCSPDGLIDGYSEGFETKAPLPETHAGYMLDRDLLVSDYGMQCHFSMAVTGAKGWWLQSFCRGLPTVRVYIPRDEKTEAICQGIAEFAAEVKAAIATTASMFEREKRNQNANRPSMDATNKGHE